MRSLRERTGRELKWRQPHAMRMEYELRDGDEVVQTLQFRSSFGSFATLEGPDGCWTFKRVGFFQTRATVRACDDEREIATFHNNTWASGGSVELANGKTLEANSNFWSTGYRFKTQDDEPVIEFKKIGGFIHQSALLEIAPAARSLEELPWIVGLGWYLIVMMQRDMGAAGGAAAAAG